MQMMGLRNGARSDLPYKRRLAYIKANGQGWIDTGHIAHGYSCYEIKERRSSGRTSSAFGCNPLVAFTNSNSIRRVRYNSFVFDGRDLSESIEQKLDGNILYYDGVKVHEFSPATFTASYTSVIFGRRINSNGGIEEISSDCELYYLKISENGIMLRDFIPVMSLNDEPCLYDSVSGQLFRNAGTGTFGYGELTAQ